MTEVTELSEKDIKNNLSTGKLDLVENTTTSLTGETVQRPLDSNHIMELQESSLTSIPNQACYTIKPSENIATFTFIIRDTNLKRDIKRKERNDYFSDDISAELVIARESSWIASTISNGQHLRRNIGSVRHDDYRIEIKSDGTKTIVNIVFFGE